MRLTLAAALFCSLAAWSAADAACVCRRPPHAHPVRHVATVKIVHRYARMTSYVACPIALVHIVRPSCDIYSQTTLPIQ